MSNKIDIGTEIDLTDLLISRDRGQITLNPELLELL
jgi:hypothetical protein